jgi:hypothetical protein
MDSYQTPLANLISGYELIGELKRIKPEDQRIIPCNLQENKIYEALDFLMWY